MVAAVVVALLVGLSRIGLGVHYLSDVIGGWLLGIAWLSVTLTAFAIGGRNAARTDGCAAHPSVFLLGTVACLTLLTGMPVSR
jgi:membrane-associated phospholipid phosphatase